MALNTNYVVGINLNDYFVDKDTGLPLSGGTITFYHDNNRSVGKYAYMLSGSPPNYTYLQLPNPITLSSSGTIIVGDTNQAVYFYPYDNEMNLDLYYVVVRDIDGNVQLVRQGWPNVAPQASPVGSTSGETDNQIINGQFHEVLFNPDAGITYSWTGAIVNQIFNVAPGWELIVSASGDGAIEVAQLPLAGNLNINTNPPYALTVLPEGANISSIRLRQTLYQNPGIWANNFLSAFMLIASFDSINHTIQMNYGTSVPDVPQTVLSGTTGTSGYNSIAGIVSIPASANTAQPPNSFTYIDVVLPTSGFVGVSSVQVLPVENNGTPQAYIQNSINKDASDLFYYYNPLIQQVPVPSITQGWDFKVNPSQWGSSFSATTGPSHYVWDQTIVWQSSDNLVSAAKDSTGELNIVLGSTGQFALVQYLSMADMHILLANGWSSIINAFTSDISGARGTLSFWYTTDVSLPNVGSNLSLILTMDANGKPATFNGNWTELPNELLGNARFILPQSSNYNPAPSVLNGWSQPLRTVSISATYCAIVVGFAPLPAQTLRFDSISVTPGALARPFAPLSYALTLAQMKYYWEQSYEPGVAAGTITDYGQMLYPYGCDITQVSGSTFSYTVNTFGILLKQIKRVQNSSIVLYSPVTGASNSVRVRANTGIYAQNVTVSSSSGFTVEVGKEQISYIGSNSVEASGSGLLSNIYMSFHYTDDARLGVV